jgi:hypothetical protein
MNIWATEADGFLTYFTGGIISPGPNPYTSGKSTNVAGSSVVTFQKPQSYQIISAGSDGLYGLGGEYAPPPAGDPVPVDSNATTTVIWNPAIEPDPTSPPDAALIRSRERDNITNFVTGNQIE